MLFRSCTEYCIPLKTFNILYDYLFYNNKNIIHLQNNKTKHSSFWILKRSFIKTLLEQQYDIIQNYQFQFAENYFLIHFYNQSKNQFINKQTTFYNKKIFTDNVPNFLLSKYNNFFFARKFVLSTKELYLKNYQFKNIYIISGLQRSGNHMFIRLLIESIKEKVLYINFLSKKYIKNLFNENLFGG